MPEDLRIDVDQLRKRMEKGEEFTIIDVRNPGAWAEATDMAAGAIRAALDSLDRVLPRIPRDQPIVGYCT